MPTRLFEEIALGALFHFIRGDEREPDTFVKIDARLARAQVGGDVIEAPPTALVCVVGL